MAVQYNLPNDLVLFEIAGSDCIGDSRNLINSNIFTLATQITSLSSNTITISATDTIEHFFTPSTRQLASNVKDNSIDAIHLKAGAITPEKLGFNASTFSFKNKIINGDMRINQRTAGAPLSVYKFDTFLIDRHRTGGSMPDTDTPFAALHHVTSIPTLSATHTLESDGAPGDYGFNYSLKITSMSAVSAVGFSLFQRFIIEGYNVQDLMLGTAQAKPFTLSFWVKSNKTGNYLLRASSGNPSPDQNDSSYTSYNRFLNIQTANTWEYKTFTFPGPTIGRWHKENSHGLSFDICLLPAWVELESGEQTITINDLNQWRFDEPYAVTNLSEGEQVNFFEEEDNNFYITGVQLEAGNLATAFEFRPFGTELALCQRYYEKSFEYSTPPQLYSNTSSLSSSVAASGKFFQGVEILGNAHMPYVNFKVTKRDTPIFTLYNATGTNLTNDPIPLSAVNVVRIFEQGPGSIGLIGYPTRTTMFIELSVIRPGAVRTSPDGYYSDFRFSGGLATDAGVRELGVTLWPSGSSLANVLNPFGFGGATGGTTGAIRLPSFLSYIVNWTADAEL